MSRRARTSIRAALIAGCAGILGALFVAARLADMLAGYKAKMLCSDIFVAGRREEKAFTDLQIDDLAPLRVITTTLDRAGRATTARAFFGFVERRARFRGDEGCVLEFEDDGRPPPVLSSLREPDDGSTELARAPRNDRLDAVLDEAFSEPDAAHPRRTRAVVVVQNGRLVAERYADGIGPGTRLLGWSMTKSIMNALVGILVGDGRLSVHAPAPVEAWRNPGDPRQQITLDHLMRMSSGLQSSDDGMVPFNDVTQMLFQTPDMAAFASAKDLDAAPGVEWRYSSGSSLIVSSILRRVLGDEAYHRFPYSALFGPLGMTSAVLETDASGTFVGSSLMYASARDWARFGLLYAQDGIWNGHRILPTGWVDYTRTPSPADPRHIYGAHFWLRVPPDYTRRHALVPDDAFHAVGHEAQFVSVVPSRNAVIVRLGKTRYPDAWDHSVFLSAVLAALDE